MQTFAAIDIGSNSCRLKIARVQQHRLKVLHEDREVTRLGASVFESGVVSPEAMASTLAALKRFLRAVKLHSADQVRAVATSALRDARNAQAFLAWGGYAYGRNADGVDARPVFAERLKSVQVALHNQDNREHDIFDSDDYFQFHGGMVASIRALTGVQPKAYFGDTSRPDVAQVRDLKEEALRVYRSRVINPKWIESIKRHGYKGGLELAATVDYIFGFDATAQIAPDFVYEGLAEHYALSQEMRDFLGAANPWALNAIAERLLEAANRELWENPAPETLEALRGVLLETETLLEAQGERKRGAVS